MITSAKKKKKYTVVLLHIEFPSFLVSQYYQSVSILNQLQVLKNSVNSCIDHMKTHVHILCHNISNMRRLDVSFCGE